MRLEICKWFHFGFMPNVMLGLTLKNIPAQLTAHLRRELMSREQIVGILDAADQALAGSEHQGSCRRAPESSRVLDQTVVSGAAASESERCKAMPHLAPLVPGHRRFCRRARCARLPPRSRARLRVAAGMQFHAARKLGLDFLRGARYHEQLLEHVLRVMRCAAAVRPVAEEHGRRVL